MTDDEKLAMFNMDFSLALKKLKDGQRVARTGWNGLGMWLARVSPPAHGQKRGYALTGDPNFVTGVRSLPWIGLKTVDECFVPWQPSQTDMLAEDWMVVT